MQVETKYSRANEDARETHALLLNISRIGERNVDKAKRIHAKSEYLDRVGTAKRGPRSLP